MIETPNYIKALLQPNATKPKGRRIWSIDLETEWLPFFVATNVMGDTAIPSEALGCPLRLAYLPDGSVRFSKSGRIVEKVVKEVADSVKMVQSNFRATMHTFAQTVATERKEDYKTEVTKAVEAGEPILAHDNQMRADAIAKVKEAELAQAIKEAEKVAQAEAVKEAERVVNRKEKKVKVTPRNNGHETEKVGDLAGVTV